MSAALADENRNGDTKHGREPLRSRSGKQVDDDDPCGGARERRYVVAGCYLETGRGEESSLARTAGRQSGRNDGLDMGVALTPPL